MGANGAGMYGICWANRAGVRVDINTGKQKEENKETSEGW